MRVLFPILFNSEKKFVGDLIVNHILRKQEINEHFIVEWLPEIAIKIFKEFLIKIVHIL